MLISFWELLIYQEKKQSKYLLISISIFSNTEITGEHKQNIYTLTQRFAFPKSVISLRTVFYSLFRVYLLFPLEYQFLF